MCVCVCARCVCGRECVCVVQGRTWAILMGILQLRNEVRPAMILHFLSPMLSQSPAADFRTSVETWVLFMPVLGQTNFEVPPTRPHRETRKNTLSRPFSQPAWAPWRTYLRRSAGESCPMWHYLPPLVGAAYPRASTVRQCLARGAARAPLSRFPLHHKTAGRNPQGRLSGSAAGLDPPGWMRRRMGARGRLAGGRRSLCGGRALAVGRRLAPGKRAGRTAGLPATECCGRVGGAQRCTSAESGRQATAGVRGRRGSEGARQQRAGRAGGACPEGDGGPRVAGCGRWAVGGGRCAGSRDGPVALQQIRKSADRG